MDFGKGFTYMFQDPDWLRKLGIGTVVGLIMLMLIPTVILWIIPLAVLIGYSVEVTRNVMNGRELPLPEWNDLGGLLGRGLKVFAALFVWTLPALLLLIPLAIGSAITDQGQGGETIGLAIVACGSCLLLIWALFVTLLMPAIYLRIAATDRFSSAFEFGKMWAFTRDNLGNVIVALLLVEIVAGIIAAVIAFVGVLALFIGLLVTIPFSMLWQYLVQAHLFGQIGRYSVTPIE